MAIVFVSMARESEPIAIELPCPLSPVSLPEPLDIACAFEPIATFHVPLACASEP